MKLKDRIAIVTGGSRGIGEAIALAFAAQGASLVLASRTRSDLERVAHRIEQAGATAAICVCDIAHAPDVDRLVGETIQRFSRIDVLVNSAGIYGPIGSLQQNDPQHWIQAIQINLIGTMLCTRAVLPHMIQQQSGSVINMSGGGAVSPFPNFSAYSASKAAVVRFTETVAEEVRSHRVRLNAIAPGAVNTRLLDEALAAAEACGKEFLEKCRQQKQNGGTPPEKAAELAVFLASDESIGITGKLVSAVWDDWRSIPQHLSDIAGTPLFTMRRIDGRNFVERKV